jgi:hypothetical protein
MADSASDPKFEAQKRRSTRVSQAVPLTVTGVDALGRPFQERTSTVVVSCHGCRYQSKHYVLKNMWVTLEVPQPEPSRPPLSARARVTWIQRPRTVRELFQIGVELEVAGNLWGISFPQPDWFPFPDQGGHLLSSADFLTQPADNLRILPLTGSDESPSLAQQMAGLIEQAKHEIQTAVHESAAEAAAMETAPLLAALQPQIEESAKRAVQESVRDAAPAVQGQLEAIHRRWNDELEKQLREAAGPLRKQIAEIGKEQADALKNDLQTLLEQARERVTQAFQDGEAGLAQSREALSSLRSQAASVTDAAILEMNQRIRVRAEETQSNWHARLRADLSAAGELWDQRIESSLESAAQKSAERLARHSQTTADRLESELGSRISSLGKVFAEAMSEAEQRLNALRAAVQSEMLRAQGALAQVESATIGVEEHAAKLDGVARNSHQELQRRAATVIEAQSRELARRAEDLLATWTEKLGPSLETAGQQAIARLVPEIDRELADRLHPATQAYARLERGVAAVDEALRHQQAAIARVSDHSVETARGRLQETVDRVSREIEEAGRVSAAKWLAEIDSKATETTHSAFESLFKTADWYEKKVQVQMQSTLEKGLEQASAGLRDKAGEISRLFASELDHYNRSYVEHAHGQLEETARGIFEHARQEAAGLASESISSFARDAQNHTRLALADLHAQAGAVLGELSAQASDQLVRSRTDIVDESSRLAAEFRGVLSADRQETIGAARHDFAKLTASCIAELRAEGTAQHARYAQSLVDANDHALDEYRKRLESVSNSWLLTTVSRLDQQSRQLIQSIAESAQAQLREASAQVFAELGTRIVERNAAPPPANAKGAAASQ